MLEHQANDFETSAFSGLEQLPGEISGESLSVQPQTPEGAGLPNIADDASTRSPQRAGDTHNLTSGRPSIPVTANKTETYLLRNSQPPNGIPSVMSVTEKSNDNLEGRPGNYDNDSTEVTRMEAQPAPEDLPTKINATVSRVLEHQKVIADLLSLLEEVQRQRDNAIHETSQFRTKLAEKSHELTALELINKSMKERLKDFTEESSSKEENIRKLEDKVVALTSELKEQTDDSTYLKSRVEQLERFQRQIASLSDKFQG